MSFHYLFAPKFSDEKSAFNIIEYPLYVMSHFFLVALKILSLTSTSLSTICFSMGLCEFILLGVC